MNRLVIAALIAATSLAACGGAGSAPVSHPTAAPQGRRIVYAWSGDAHSSAVAPRANHRSILGSIISVLETIAGTEPIAVGAPANPNDPNDPAIRTGESVATVSAVEVDAAGSPVPSAPPSYSVTNTSVATTASVPQPSGTPLAQVVAISPGSTATVVVFPDGLSGTVPVNAYETIHPSCPAKQAPSLPANADGYRYDPASHTLVAAAGPDTADVYLSGPGCDDAFRDSSATTTTLHVPLGYESVPDSTALGDELTVGAFTPAGTTLDLTNGQSFPPFLIMKTATPGVFIKWRVTSFDGGVNHGELDGDALPSDPTATFPF